MIEFSVLSSSSSANCSFIRTKDFSLLVDCGLSAKRTEERLRALDIEPTTLDGILLTHEHSDHTKGLSVLSRRYEIPIYCTPKTSSHLKNIHDVSYFESGESFRLGQSMITAVPTVHDAVDPVAFVIESEGAKLAHITDLGKVTPAILEAAQHCHALVIESNYDEELLMQCEYPWTLKERIASSHGHLSNRHAALFALQLNKERLQHIVLAHLSKNSNTPEQAERTFNLHYDIDSHQELHIASDTAHTPLLTCTPEPGISLAVSA